MTWFRVDDSFHAHPKTVALFDGPHPAAAVATWTLAGSWCASQLTDGLLSVGVVRRLGLGLDGAEELVRVGLWERTETGYAFVDWADWNPSRDEVEERREKDRERMAAWRRAKGEDPGPPKPSRRDKLARHVVTSAAVTPNVTAASRRDSPECHAVTSAVSHAESHDSRPVPSLPVPREQEASRVPAHVSVPAREAVPVAVVSPPARPLSAAPCAEPRPGPAPRPPPDEDPLVTAGRALRVAWSRGWQEHVGELAPSAGTSAIEAAAPWLVDYRRRRPGETLEQIATALVARFFAAKHAGAKAKGRKRSRPRVEWLLEDPGRYLELPDGKPAPSPEAERERAEAVERMHRDREDRALLRGAYDPQAAPEIDPADLPPPVSPEAAAKLREVIARGMATLERHAPKRTSSAGPQRLSGALGDESAPKLDPFRAGGALGPPLDPEVQQRRLRAQADALRAQLATEAAE